MTTLVNYRTHNTHPARTTFVPIDRRSIFGNEYYIGKDGTREEVIEKYKIDFYKRLKNEDGFKEKVLELTGKTLICWCTPLPCHGDVIIEYLKSLKTEGLE